MKKITQRKLFLFSLFVSALFLLICSRSSPLYPMNDWEDVHIFFTLGRSVTDGLVHLLRREAMSKGVKVTFCDDGAIVIDLHIMVDRGVNIAAIGASIISEVKYNVTKSTGTAVKAVNVYVDSITDE